jgi:ribulose-phosphate 3-epimerase
LRDLMPKVAQARRFLRDTGSALWIQVDGGVDADTIEECARAGADVFVAGSAVYGAADPAAAVEALRAHATAAIDSAGAR